MGKNKIIDKMKNLVGIETKSNIQQAITLLQTARSCIEAYAAERAAKQLHVGTLSQMNKELGEIGKKLSGYVEN